MTDLVEHITIDIATSRVSLQRVVQTSLAAVLIVAASLSNIVWLSTGALWFTLALSVPAASRARAVVLALPVTLGGVSCLFTAFAMAHITMDLRWIVLILALLAVTGSLFVPSTPRLPVFDRSDVWASGAAVLATLAVGHSAVMGSASNYLAQLITGGTDGARHISLGVDVLRHNGYLALAPSDAHLFPGLQNYPQGLAGGLALVFRAVIGNHPDNAAILRASAWAMTAMFAVVIWLAMTLVIATVARVCNGSPANRALAASTALVGSAFVVTTESLIHAPGFFSQEAALMGFLAAMCIAVEAKRPTLRATSALALTAVAMTQTWYLLTPALLPVVARYLLRVRPRMSRHLAILAASLPFIAFPVITGPSPTKQLVAAGLTNFPDNMTLVLLLIIPSSGLIALRVNRTRGNPIGALAMGFASTAALTAFIVMYQLRAHAFGYYAIKGIVIVLLVGSLVGAAGLGAAVNRLSDSRNVTLAVSLTVATVILALASWHRFSAETRTGAGERGHAREIEAFLDRHPRGLQTGALAFIVDGCDHEDIRLSQGLAQLGVTWTPSVFTALSHTFPTPQETLESIEEFARDPTTRAVEVYTANECRPALISHVRGLPKLTVIEVSK